MVSTLNSWERKPVIIPLERETENLKPYAKKFRTPTGAIVDNTNLDYMRFRYSATRDLTTGWPIRERTVAHRVDTQSTDLRGNPVNIPLEILYNLSELEVVA